MTYAELLEFFGGAPNPDDYVERALSDGRTISVYPITFGRARLSIGPTGKKTYDDTW